MLHFISADWSFGHCSLVSAPLSKLRLRIGISMPARFNQTTDKSVYFSKQIITMTASIKDDIGQ